MFPAFRVDARPPRCQRNDVANCIGFGPGAEHQLLFAINIFVPLSKIPVCLHGVSIRDVVQNSIVRKVVNVIGGHHCSGTVPVRIRGVHCLFFYIGLHLGDLGVDSWPPDPSRLVQNPQVNLIVFRAWLGPDPGGKSMVLGRQRELSGQPVIKIIRNHPETPFLGLQVRSGASWGVQGPKTMKICRFSPKSSKFANS